MHSKENRVFYRMLLAGVILAFGLGPMGCLCGPSVTAQSRTSQTKDRKISIARPVQTSERRVALVIGNGNYPFGSLRNPVNDATDMAQTLTNLGFEVTSRTNVTQREMLALISAFGRQLQSGDVGLFYFAGHGVQVAGDNFLIPVDAEIKTDADVDVYCVELNKVLKQMQTAGNRLNIVILDACRNNPFLTRSWRNAQPGLAEVKATSGMYIAFATSPGATASDGTGRNGLYTQALLQALNQSGIPIEQTFKTVFREVKQKSNGQQLPYLLSLFDDDFYFLPEQPTPEPEPEKPAVAIPSAAAIEEEAWKVVQNSKRPEDFEAFLAEYPNGDRAKMARIMLSKLNSKKEPVPSTVPKTRPAPPESDSVAAPPIPKAEPRPVPTTPPATMPARKKRADSSLKSLKTTRFILDRGLNKLTHGDYDGAIQDLYQARELDPAQTSEIDQSLAWAYYLRGLTRKNQQNFSGAILDLKNSVELNPNLAEAHATLGRLYFREGNLEAAVPSSQRALDLDPQNTQYQSELLKQYLQLGGHQYEKAQFEKAELAYVAALKLSPSDALVHTCLGKCQAAQGKNLEAETSFREAVRVQPASGEYSKNLAVHLFQQNMFAEAIPHLKSYLQTEPTDGTMHFTLGLAYEQTLDFQNAEAALATALRLKNSEAEYHHGLGRVLEKQGRIQAALASYQTAAGLDPRNAAFSTDLHRLSELLKPASVATSGNLQLRAITKDLHDPDTFLVLEFQVHHPADSRLEARLYAVDRSLDQKIGSDEIKLTKASRNVILKFRGQGPNLPILRHYKLTGGAFQILVSFNNALAAIIMVTVDSNGDIKYSQLPVAY